MKSQIVELHSERCQCRGYLWQAWWSGMAAVRSRCCLPGQDMPAGAVRVPASLWMELGMPRSVEKLRVAVSPL